MLYLSIPAFLEVRYFGKHPALVAYYLDGRMLGAKWVKEMDDKQRAVLDAAIARAGEEGNLPRPFDGAIDYDDVTVDEMGDHAEYELQEAGNRQEWERRNRGD